MRKLVFVAILANIIIISSGQRSPDGKNICPEAVKRFTESLLKVSIGFLKSYADANPRETGTVSAYATLTISAALAANAEGETKNEIYNTLNLKSRNEIICVADVTSYPLSQLPNCTQLGIAIGIYGDDDYQFTPDFISNAGDILIGDIKNFDFSNPDKTANAINEMVSSRTNNRVSTIIDDTTIFNSSTQLISVAGASFVSEWEIEFQSGKKLEFRISPTESVLQEFLYQDAVYLYGHSEILGAEVAQVNFCCGSNFYLWVIVPDCLFTESDLIDKMNQNVDWYYELKKIMKPTRLDLYIIRYEKSTTVDSKALLLDTTNIKSIYNNETIHLKGAIECDKPAALSYSIQKTFVSSSPKGGPIPNGPLSNGTKKTFLSNSPHVFIIFREDEVYITAVIRGPIF